jgi:hypothetical protein
VEGGSGEGGHMSLELYVRLHEPMLHPALTFSFFWTKVAVLVLEEATIVVLRFCFLDLLEPLEDLLELEDLLALFALVCEEGIVFVEMFTFSSS